MDLHPGGAQGGGTHSLHGTHGKRFSSVPPPNVYNPNILAPIKKQSDTQMPSGSGSSLARSDASLVTNTSTPESIPCSDLIGQGLLSHPKKLQPHSPGTNAAFHEHLVFEGSSVVAVDIRVIAQEGRNRRFKSAGLVVLEPRFHRFRTYTTTGGHSVDMWAEYRDKKDPLITRVFLEDTPNSDISPSRMIHQPKVMDAKTHAPYHRVRGISGSTIFHSFIRWTAFKPDVGVSCPRIPYDIHLPINDVKSFIDTMGILDVPRACNFGFMGDSTLPGIVNPLREFIYAMEMIPQAPKYGHAVHVFGYGKTLHEIFYVPAIDSTKCNFLIFKFQNDFLNLYGMTAPDWTTKEMYIKTALRDFSYEIKHLITLAQNHCMGASLIFLGMNPINTDQNAQFMSNDPHAIDFAKRVDEMYRDIVATRCDVHFISIVDIFDHNNAILDPQTCLVGAHLSKMANFFLAKEVRRVVMGIYAARARVGLGDIPRFSASQMAAGNLSCDQEIYCAKILGLVQKNVQRGKGKEEEPFRL